MKLSPDQLKAFWRDWRALAAAARWDADEAEAQRRDLLARALDGHEGQPDRAKRPAVEVPLAARPRRISVTDVDRLAADPYSFYAKAILKLRLMSSMQQAA
jgi:ATP-dependent helicase/nuclease subunit B